MEKTIKTLKKRKKKYAKIFGDMQNDYVILHFKFKQYLLILLAMKKLIKTTLLIAMITATITMQGQTTRYVKLNGTGDGSSWTNAAGNIQDMINCSNIGDNVWVAAGTYNLTAISALTITNWELGMKLLYIRIQRKKI